jgi:hypothetical protein
MLQCAAFGTPGSTGQFFCALSQTVMNHSKACPRKVSIVFDCWPLMSIPISAMT